METIPKTQEIIHASCVAVGLFAVLLTGKSGSGKSALALELMSRGAMLVADDRTILNSEAYGVTASCPIAILGKIEARGMGILVAESVKRAQVHLVVDLNETETDRLPPFRETIILGHQIPLIYSQKSAHFAAALLQYIKGGRNA